MNFTETVELLLARIYDIDKNSPGIQINIGDLARALGVEDVQIIWDVARTLDRRGLIKGIFALGGDPECFMTGEGRLFVEEGGDTTIIRQYQKDPQHFIHVINSSNVQIIAGGHVNGSHQTQNYSGRQEIFNSLDLIKKTLEDDSAIGPAEKNDAICDVDTLKSQLSRQKPDKAIIDPILSRLANIATIGTAIQQLSPIIWKLFQ